MVNGFSVAGFIYPRVLFILCSKIGPNIYEVPRRDEHRSYRISIQRRTSYIFIIHIDTGKFIGLDITGYNSFIVFF